MARQRAHETNIHMHDLKWYKDNAQPNTRKTQHALNSNNKKIILCWNIILRTLVKHTLTLREHQFAGVFSPQTRIMTTWCRGMFDTRRFGGFIGISAHLSHRAFHRWLRTTHLTHCMPPFVLNLLYEAAVKIFRWLFNLGDVLLPEKGGDYPTTMRHSVTVLTTKLSLQCCLATGSSIFFWIFPNHAAVGRSSKGNKGGFIAIVKCPKMWLEPPPSWNSVALESSPTCSPNTKQSMDSIEKAGLEYGFGVTIVQNPLFCP